ncbi:MAG: WYL domain-containing protein, partial [Cetobacterium sp.]
MEKKIRITLPKKIAEVLENDMKEFSIKKNTLLNYIFSEAVKQNCKLFSENFRKDETTVIQFNLNKKNREGYYDFLEENKIGNESEFFRDILSNYGKLGKKNRERFLFREVIERINYSIKESKIIKISFKDGKVIEVEPYLIETSKQEVSNYIFCYNLKEENWKNYKIKYIDSVYIKKNGYKIRDRSFVEKMKTNFDPFLSFGQNIKVRLTEAGEIMFRELEMNKPKIIDKDVNVYTLECSEEKAKRYFSFFLDEVEILEPIQLRDWFKEKYEKA